jgi:hypothetical protein
MSTTSELVERLRTDLTGYEGMLFEAANALEKLERENARMRAALDETILDLRIYTDIGIITSRAIERRAALAGSGEK